MIKTVLALSLSALVAGCTFKGFKLPPDASLSWKLCNERKIYPDIHIPPGESIERQREMLRQMGLRDKRKRDDMRSCGYNPIAGGDQEADACVRKKGWYRSRMDIYPENKIYEQCQHE